MMNIAVDCNIFDQNCCIQTLEPLLLPASTTGNGFHWKDLLNSSKLDDSNELPEMEGNCCISEKIFSMHCSAEALPKF